MMRTTEGRPPRAVSRPSSPTLTVQRTLGRERPRADDPANRARPGAQSQHAHPLARAARDVVLPVAQPDDEDEKEEEVHGRRHGGLHPERGSAAPGALVRYRKRREDRTKARGAGVKISQRFARGG